MKLRKSYCVTAIAFCVVLISGIMIRGLAADVKTVPPDDEEVTIVMDHGMKNSPQDAKEVYLYSDGIGGYTEVQKVWDNGASQEDMIAEDAEEVYLASRKINDTTYEYVDESGSVIITMYLSDEAPRGVPLAATRYGFNWRIDPKSSKRGDVDLDVSSGTHRLYVSATIMNGNATYIGFYATNNNTYYWIEPPTSSSISSVYFLVNSSHPINFALKNDSNFVGKYLGEYWITLN